MRRVGLNTSGALKKKVIMKDGKPHVTLATAQNMLRGVNYMHKHSAREFLYKFGFLERGKEVVDPKKGILVGLSPFLERRNRWVEIKNSPNFMPIQKVGAVGGWKLKLGNSGPKILEYLKLFGVETETIPQGVNRERIYVNKKSLEERYNIWRDAHLTVPEAVDHLKNLGISVKSGGAEDYVRRLVSNRDIPKDKVWGYLFINKSAFLEEINRIKGGWTHPHA